MIDREEFDHLVRDVLTNLYDTAALEVHPLAAVLPRPPRHQASRAARLHQLLVDAIETLRPPGQEPSMEAVEWRPYLVLYGRYVEGLRLQDLQARLSLSPRQLRREHGRALRAVAALLWDQALPGLSERDARKEGEAPDEWDSSLLNFEIVREPLSLADVVHGVARILERRIQSQGAGLSLDLGVDLPRVQSDRVILRQILLSLINHALETRVGGDILVRAEARERRVALDVQFQAAERTWLGSQEQGSLDTPLYWMERLDATLDQIAPPDQEGVACLRLLLPRSRESLVLVVDDQEAAIKMFSRYLSRASVRVVGVQKPEQVLSLARDLDPAAITLDVMMPTIDGWEILQSLKADPETRDIPVIVCSVWDEPELAASLGAARFLKKPITQGDLWDALVELGVLDRSGGSSPADT